MTHDIEVTVNGVAHQITVEPRKTLLSALRDQLHMTGTKEGCSTGDCGACTVILNGKTVTSCLVLAAEADGSKVTTIEGFATEEGLHPVQQAIIDKGGVQCGFRTAGIIVASIALLEENPKPTPDQIRRGLAGNLCRCTGYTKVVEAITEAATKMKKPTRKRTAKRA